MTSSKLFVIISLQPIFRFLNARVKNCLKCLYYEYWQKSVASFIREWPCSWVWNNAGNSNAVTHQRSVNVQCTFFIVYALILHSFCMRADEFWSPLQSPPQASRFLHFEQISRIVPRCLSPRHCLKVAFAAMDGIWGDCCGTQFSEYTYSLVCISHLKIISAEHDFCFLNHKCYVSDS